MAIPTETYRFKLFLEGVEVPSAFWEANINTSVGGHAMCTISMTPTVAMRYVLPRCLVHLFWWHNGAYRTIFSGEVVGRGLEQGVSRRAITFSAIGFSSYWDHAYRLYDDAGYGHPQADARAFNISATQIDSTTARVTGLAHVFLFKLYKDATAPISVRSLISALFDKMVDTNTFFRMAQRRLKLTERVYTANNAFCAQLLQRFITSSGRSTDIGQGPLASLTPLLGTLLGNIYYQSITMTSPASRSGVPYEQIFFPENDFADVPRCNVFFPDHYGELKYQHRFLHAPTRTWISPVLRTSETPVEGGATQPVETYLHYYAPNEIRDLVNSESTGSRRILLPEEIYKGGIFQQRTLRGFSTSQGTDQVVESVVAKELEWPGTVANFYHARARAEAQSVPQIVGRFNPFLVAGLPGMVLNEDMGPIIGTISSYSHILSGKGRAHTVTQLHRVRTVNIGTKPDYVPQWMWDLDQAPVTQLHQGNGANEQRSVWYDASLSPQNIAESFYRHILGTDLSQTSILASPEENGPRLSSVAEGAEALYNYYFRGLDDAGRIQYARTYNARPIATEEEVFSAIGAMAIHNQTGPNWQHTPHEYSGSTPLNIAGHTVTEQELNAAIQSIEGPFLPGRQQWAQAVRAGLSGQRILSKR